jgi:hypothetical protein
MITIVRRPSLSKTHMTASPFLPHTQVVNFCRKFSIAGLDLNDRPKAMTGGTAEVDFDYWSAG